MPITLVIAEGQCLFRQSLRLLLERESDLKVVGEAADGQAVCDVVTRLKPDIVLMGIEMPTLDGVAATRLIRQRVPSAKVLILSIEDDDMRIVAAARAGAWAYIPKDADRKEFLRMIRDAYRDEAESSPFLVARIARLVSVEGQEEMPGGGLPALTEREREILACAAAGCGNKEIADRLCVSSETVKTHLHHIYQKLGVSGRVEAILSYLHPYKRAV